MAIVYCSWATGDDTTGTGTAANPYKTITKASTSRTAGDEVRVAKSPDPTALTGTNAGLYRALVMACNSGSHALTGTDATFNANYIFALGVGSYVLVGTNAGLFILSPTPACRTYAIDSEGRLYAIWAESRDYAIPFENRTLEAKCH